MSTTLPITMACATCAASAANGGGSDALNGSVLLLLGFILAVLGMVAFFMLRIVIRQKRYAEQEHSSTLQIHS